MRSSASRILLKREMAGRGTEPVRLNIYAIIRVVKIAGRHVGMLYNGQIISLNILTYEGCKWKALSNRKCNWPFGLRCNGKEIHSRVND